MDTWWLTITTPDGAHCWPLGDPDDDTRDDLIHRAQVAAGLPADTDPLTRVVQLAPGKPHATILNRAVVHELADLADVDQAAVDAYRAACADRQRAASADALDAVLATVDDATLTAALERRAVAVADGAELAAPAKPRIA